MKTPKIQENSWIGGFEVDLIRSLSQKALNILCLKWTLATLQCCSQQWGRCPSAINPPSECTLTATASASCQHGVRIKTSGCERPWRESITSSGIQCVYTRSWSRGETSGSEMWPPPPPLLPSGSTSRANFSASEVAKSELAGDTARMREFGLEMKDRIISCTWVSMSSGWSPTGT